MAGVVSIQRQPDETYKVVPSALGWLKQGPRGELFYRSEQLERAPITKNLDGTFLFPDTYTNYPVPLVEAVPEFPDITANIGVIRGSVAAPIDNELQMWNVQPLFPVPIRGSIAKPVEAIGTVFYARAQSAARTLMRENRRDRAAIGGLAGPLRMRTVVELADEHGESLGELADIRGCSISINNLRDATWRVDLEVEDLAQINPEEDWARVFVEAYMPMADGSRQWKRYSYGHYKFMEWGKTHRSGSSSYKLTGDSGEVLFLEDDLRKPLVVKKGQKILKTVRDTLMARGIRKDRIALPMQYDKPFPRDRVFDPFGEESRSSWLRVWNEMLNSAAFAALHTDRYGRYTTRRYTDIRGQDPAVRYTPDGEWTLMTNAAVDDTSSREGFANAVIVYSTDPMQEPPIRAYAESQQSYKEVGYWRVNRIPLESITDQDSAQRMADAQLAAALSAYNKLSWESRPDPEREQREYYEIHIPRKKGKPVFGIYRGDEIAWDLYPFPKAMTFSGSRGVKMFAEEEQEGAVA